jgi:glycosyltransferase involved in cell wall biosynthesis
MRKPKIILHSNIAWTISNFRLELIKFFISKNYEVLCIADMDNFNANSAKEIEETSAKFIHIPINRKGLNPFRDIIYAFRLFQILKTEKPDLIFNYTIKPVIYGSLVSRLLKIKSVAVITGLGYVFIEKGLLHKIVKLLYKLSLFSCKKVMFLNAEDQAEFIDNKIISASKALVLPGEGVNTDFFAPMVKTTANNKVVFIAICRLLWDKGLREYFNAAELLKQKYPNSEFQLLGFIDENNPSSVSRADIQILEEKGIILYLGVTNDVRKYIAESDCIVLPSYYREGLPRTLLEAASMGKPIITTNSVGCKDTVEDGITGFLCKPRDSDDLCNKMEQILLMSCTEREEMGGKGRIKIMNEFDQRIVNKTYEDLILDIYK